MAESSQRRQLQCPGCFQPLLAPVYQCRNGHSVCSACCIIAKNCPSCNRPIGADRNIAIENIIESLRVDCKHAPQGCSTRLKYTERDVIEEHQSKLCEYRPVQCPVQTPRRCTHIGPKAGIPAHLVEEHGVQVIDGVSKNRTARFSMKASCPMTMLRIDEAWLLVNCWKARFNFGSFLVCTVFESSSDKKVLHKLSIERIRLNNEVKFYLTFVSLLNVARSHNELDIDSLTLEDTLKGPFLNIPHEDHEWSEMEFDFRIKLY